jgi:hypothetical protein
MIRLELPIAPKTKSDATVDRQRAVQVFQAICEPPATQHVQVPTSMTHCYLTGSAALLFPAHWMPTTDIAVQTSQAFFLSEPAVSACRGIWNALSTGHTTVHIQLATTAGLTEAKPTEASESDRRFGWYLAELVSNEYPTDIPAPQDMIGDDSFGWPFD